MDAVPCPEPCWIIIPRMPWYENRCDKESWGRVGWKQSFALYRGNDKSVLTDNPPFFCFDLTSLAHPPGLLLCEWTTQCEKGGWKRERDESKRGKEK